MSITAVGCTRRKIDRLQAAVQDDSVTASTSQSTPAPSHFASLPSAAHLQQLALAHRSSMVLFTASELDVFTHIHEGRTTVDAIAAATGAQHEPLRMVLEWCVGDGTLTSDGTHYQNTPATTAYL